MLDADILLRNTELELSVDIFCGWGQNARGLVSMHECISFKD